MNSDAKLNAVPQVSVSTIPEFSVIQNTHPVNENVVIMSVC